RRLISQLNILQRTPQRAALPPIRATATATLIHPPTVTVNPKNHLLSLYRDRHSCPKTPEKGLRKIPRRNAMTKSPPRAVRSVLRPLPAPRRPGLLQHLAHLAHLAHHELHARRGANLNAQSPRSRRAAGEITGLLNRMRVARRRKETPRVSSAERREHQM